MHRLSGLPPVTRTVEVARGRCGDRYYVLKTTEVGTGKVLERKVRTYQPSPFVAPLQG